MTLEIIAVALGVLVTGPAGVEWRDLGSFGPTCPVPPMPGPSSRGPRLVRIEPGAARIPVDPDPEFPLAVGRRMYQLPRPTRWPRGTPTTIAVLGADAGSLALARTLPPGSAVFVLPPAHPDTLTELRRACPGCAVEPGRARGLKALGVRAYPAVLRWTGSGVEVTEGAP